MLTDAQEAIIEQTAPVVAEHLEAITQRFYPLMFERYPEVSAFFNQKHQGSGDQPRALAQAVLAYVQLRRTPGAASEALSTAVHKHVSLGIQPEHYPIVGECLLAAVAQELGDAVTPEVADAWGALYQELADLLIAVEEQYYSEFANRRGGWRGLRRFRVAHRRRESQVITSFELEPEDGGPVADFEPGQYVGMRLVIDGEPVYRHFSLSAPPNGSRYRVSIKREPDGYVSRHWHETMAVGDTVDLLPPAGELTLVPGDDPVVLVSGGVGQTPLLPIAHHALEHGREVVYIHAALSPDHHALIDDVQALCARHPGRMRAITVYEEADDDAGADHIGRVDRSLLARYAPESEAQYYFVGPGGFMTAVGEGLAALGVPEERRHYERFGPSRPLAG